MTNPNAQPPAALTVWHQCVAQTDMTALGDILADEVVFRSPFLWKPKEGKAITTAILSAAVRVFSDFTYHRQMTDGTSWTLEFSARVGDFSLKGVDIIHLNAAGLIDDFEVMVRPAKGLNALAEAMARELAAQGVAL